MAEADLRDVLCHIDVPTLLLYGDQDVRSPVEVGRALHDGIPGSSLVILPGVGHFTGQSHDNPSEIHVFGDTGVGKSRLVYEALAIEGVRERVLVVPDASRWDVGLLSLVAQCPERSLIAVVDDCDAEQRRSLAQYSGMARGRVRLVTIGSRATRERPVAICATSN